VNTQVLIRKVFRVGDSRVIALPPDWSRDANYVAIRPRDGELVVMKIEVESRGKEL
jgi:virulence-associated protein VagC